MTEHRVIKAEGVNEGVDVTMSDHEECETKSTPESAELYQDAQLRTLCTG